MDFTFILAIVLFVLILLFVYLYIRNKYVNQPTNFKVFFILGVVFILVGIAMKFYGFIFIGLVFMIIGLANKKKWREFEDWADLTPVQRKIKIIVIIVLSIVLLYFSINYFWIR